MAVYQLNYLRGLWRGVWQQGMTQHIKGSAIEVQEWKEMCYTHFYEDELKALFADAFYSLITDRSSIFVAYDDMINFRFSLFFSCDCQYVPVVLIQAGQL